MVFDKFCTFRSLIPRLIDSLLNGNIFLATFFDLSVVFISKKTPVKLARKRHSVKQPPLKLRISCGAAILINCAAFRSLIGLKESLMRLMVDVLKKTRYELYLYEKTKEVPKPTPRYDPNFGK